MAPAPTPASAPQPPPNDEARLAVEAALRKAQAHARANAWLGCVSWVLLWGVFVVWRDAHGASFWWKLAAIALLGLPFWVFYTVNARRIASGLDGIDDPRAVGPLLDAVRLAFRGPRRAVLAALERAVPRLGPDDLPRLDAMQRAMLRRLLAARHGTPPALKVAILAGLEQIADERDVATIEALTRVGRRTDPAVQLAAERSLAAIRERDRRRRAAASLLRPADAPTASLLRPADAAAPGEQLLRPADEQESAAERADMRSGRDDR